MGGEVKVRHLSSEAKARVKCITTRRASDGTFEIISDIGVKAEFKSQFRMHQSIQALYLKNYRLVNRTQPEGVELMRKHRLQHFPE